MNDPVTISVGKRNEGSKNVEHHYYMVNRNDRYLALKRLVDVNPEMYGLIFCRTKVETSDVVQQLRKDAILDLGFSFSLLVSKLLFLIIDRAKLFKKK